MGVRIVAGGDVQLAQGSTWAIVFDLLDTSGCVAYTTDTPVVTVQTPAGETPVAATVTELNGRWLAEHVTDEAGRHVATITTTEHGDGYTTAVVRAVLAADGMPDLAEVKVYLGAVSASDTQIQDALDAETDAQRSACRVPAAYPNDLRQALKRRVACNLAKRGIPLAVIPGDADVDPTRPPRDDPEVQRFEKPWRRLKMG